MKLLLFSFALLPLVLCCSIRFEFSNKLPYAVSVKVYGPYLRQSTERLIPPNGMDDYEAEGSLFSCHGEYKIVVTGLNNNQVYTDKREFFEDTIAHISIVQNNRTGGPFFDFFNVDF
uniref:Uncharacterized protein n=1 Tax=Plectus sambesii TaxID=2011161 RepID=A0A914W6C7_9BILA